MRTKKTNKKIGVKDLASEVSKKREKSKENEIKKAVMKIIRDDPELYKKIAIQGSVSTIVDQMIPLGKELIYHPKVFDEMVHNEATKEEILENPTTVTEILQIPEVADKIAREPSLIVDVIQDASQVKSLTKNLSDLSTLTSKKRDRVSKKSTRKKNGNFTKYVTKENCLWSALLVSIGAVIATGNVQNVTTIFMVGFFRQLEFQQILRNAEYSHKVVENQKEFLRKNPPPLFWEL